MKNAKVLIPLLLVLIVGSAVFFMVRGNSSQLPEEEVVEETEPNVKQMSARDIGLTLELAANKKTVNMEITKLAGIKTIEYEVSYDAEVVEEGEKIQIPRGVVGSPIEIAPTDRSLSREILLGTSSANVSKYDKVVSNIKFVIKVNFDNGEIGSIEETVPFE